MTDKGRLEEAKEQIKSMEGFLELDDLSGFLNEAQNFYDDGHFGYLVERVQELETYVETGTYIQRKLRKENKRYREVIEQLYNFDGDVQAHSALADMLCGEALEGDE